MTYAYGSTESGVELNDIAPSLHPDLRANDIRTEYCNSKGRFSFANLPDGEYFVVTTVRWKQLGINHRNQHLMKRVAVTGGVPVDVSLAG